MCAVCKGQPNWLVEATAAWNASRSEKRSHPLTSQARFGLIDRLAKANGGLEAEATQDKKPKTSPWKQHGPMDQRSDGPGPHLQYGTASERSKQCQATRTRARMQPGMQSQTCPRLGCSEAKPLWRNMLPHKKRSPDKQATWTLKTPHPILLKGGPYG